MDLIKAMFWRMFIHKHEWNEWADYSMMCVKCLRGKWEMSGKGIEVDSPYIIAGWWGFFDASTHHPCYALFLLGFFIHWHVGPWFDIKGPWFRLRSIEYIWCGKAWDLFPLIQHVPFVRIYNA